MLEERLGWNLRVCPAARAGSNLRGYFGSKQIEVKLGAMPMTRI